MTIQHKINAAGSVDRAHAEISHEILTAIQEQTKALLAQNQIHTDQRQVETNLLSSQLEGIYEQLQRMRTDLRAESVWHKAWASLRRLLSLSIGVI